MRSICPFLSPRTSRWISTTFGTKRSPRWTPMLRSFTNGFRGWTEVWRKFRRIQGIGGGGLGKGWGRPPQSVAATRRVDQKAGCTTAWVVTLKETHFSYKIGRPPHEKRIKGVLRLGGRR